MSALLSSAVSGVDPSQTSMQDVYVSIGSNIDRRKHIRAALGEMRDAFGELVTSPIYRTPAVGFVGDDFFNLVASFKSDQSPQQIQAELHRIEDEHGRVRTGERFSARTLDIDILLLGDQIVDMPGLSIPRDEIAEYAFVLAPLADIASEVKHPQLNISIAGLWRQMKREKPLDVEAMQLVDMGVNRP